MISMNSIEIIINYLGSQLLGIFGILLAIFIYKKQFKKQAPCYGVTGFNIIEDIDSKSENIKISHFKKGVFIGEVKDLTFTKIILWNDGNAVINYKNDIVPKNALKIIIDKRYKILDKKIIYVTKDDNDFTANLSDDNSYIDINFEYIGKLQGMVIQILHNGKSFDDVSVEGSFKDCQLEHRNLRDELPTIIPLKLPFIKSKEIRFNFTSLGLYLMMLIILIQARSEYLNEKLDFNSFVIFSMMIIGLFLLQKWESKRIIPKGFEKFAESINKNSTK
jgi:hypothetical protein